jgi:hypothetical protein
VEAAHRGDVALNGRKRLILSSGVQANEIASQREDERRKKNPD